ncbi:MerR family transcriptional regulator [Deltaproteobacteria bacterium]|nr:MerR family transcriptional regulator [Deltaproteobacteria bacterium]
MSQTVTHKDLARKLKVSETTIKSYRRKFAECIPVASKGKPIRFLPDAVLVCARIRDLFDLGMSIEEVRARLAQEFSWISLITKSDPENSSVPAGMPPEFTTALSNLAKSMVTLLGQQSEVMRRMDKLETTIKENAGAAQESRQDGGVKAEDFKSLLEEVQGYLKNALMPLQQLQRLNEVQLLAETLQQSVTNIVDAAKIVRNSIGNKGYLEEDANELILQGTQPLSSKVVQFPGNSGQASGLASAHIPSALPQDPPRAFLLKPMVVRTVDGTYIGAGGKLRGRFTLNDFKALLVYGRQPGEHYSLRWEQIGNDWIATLTQPQVESFETWQMQLKEVMSQSGVGVVELVRFIIRGEDAHPAEFCAFVASLAEA